MKQTPHTHFIGSEAEMAAYQHLKKAGLRLLEQNYRCPLGEIDLIMREGEDIIFIEVRSRHHDIEGALESIDYYKQTKIIKTATYYLQKKRYYDKLGCRFDVVGINYQEIKWIKNAFYADYF